MPKYRKRPVVIEAFQFFGAATTAFPDWLYAAQNRGVVSPRGASLRISTLEGTMTAVRGDWIIKGIAGELYPCKPDIFEATYEKVEG